MFPSLSAFAVCCVRILSRKSSSRKRMKNDPIISWLRGRRVGQRRQIIESHESMLRARLCKQALWHSIQKNLIKFKSFYVHWNFQLIENGNSWFNVDKYFIHPYIYVNKKKICNMSTYIVQFWLKSNKPPKLLIAKRLFDPVKRQCRESSQAATTGNAWEAHHSRSMSSRENHSRRLMADCCYHAIDDVFCVKEKLVLVEETWKWRGKKSLEELKKHLENFL